MPVQHIELPDDWRGDVEKPREEWCPTCKWDGVWKNLLPTEAEDERFGRTFTKSTLSSSASEGHICCTVLLILLQKRGGEKYDRLMFERFSEIGLLNFYKGPSLQPDVKTVMKYSSYKFVTVGSSPVPPGILGCRPDEIPSLDTGSETSVTWAKDRVNDCQLNHALCHYLQSSKAPDSYIPSRLLYIPHDPTEGLILRLKESVPSDAKYVALSHCWGSRNKWPRCLTTNSNYESQLRRISWETIPQTFRDTAIFARKLGLEYIWIDSMCIIQGDEKDWQKESTQMYSVYSNAHITFGALHAHDSHEGLFSQRPPESLFSLLTLGFRGKKCHVQLYNVPDERSKVEQQIRIQAGVNPEEHPLLSRAWAFQERLVSPRALFFGSKELIWECPTGRSCEEDRYPLHPWRRAIDDFIRLGGQSTLMRQYSIITNKTDDIATQWLQIVGYYSKLELSKPTDRLPAIAGVAQRLAQGNPGDEYICGLWRNSILQGLAYLFPMRDNLPNHTSPHIDYGPSTAARPDYIAPTWSWASAQGSVVVWSQGSILPFAKLTNVNIRYADNDQYGRVAPGSSITIQGPALDCVWDLNYESDGIFQFEQSISIPCSGGTMSATFFKEYATYSGLGQREAIKVLLLLLCTQDDGDCKVLILRRIGKSGHYFRVGILAPWEHGHNFQLTRPMAEAPVREFVLV